MTIAELQPNNIWRYFDQIRQIPRASRKEHQIVDFLTEFARQHGLQCQTDAALNVLITKPAQPGQEHRPTIVLQSHTDMVCEKHSTSPHNFDTDPIDAYIEDGWVRARGTTLGADDGIGIATQLAVLASRNIAHGAIECLFTADEESGMTGAMALDANWLKGKTLINLDSEDDGEIFIGCSGGMDSRAIFKTKMKPAPNSHTFYRVELAGLKGGHSGDEIHKGHGNSIKIVTRFLVVAIRQRFARIAQIGGGNLRNAIPREAWAVVAVPNEQLEGFEKDYQAFTETIWEEYKHIEPNLSFRLSLDQPQRVLGRKMQKKIVDALQACPHGEQRWSTTIANLVETSTNLASIQFADQQIEVVTSQRSSSKTGLANIAQTVRSVFELAGAHIIQSDGYPGWLPRLESPILEVATLSFEGLFGKKPLVKAIHAGLECGLFLEKYPEMDMISIGPTLRGVHSPDERVEIATVERFWRWLVDILEKA